MKSDLKKKGDGGDSSEEKAKRKMKKKLTISKMKREAYEELPSFAIGGIALVASSMSNACESKRKCNFDRPKNIYTMSHCPLALHVEHGAES